jgi:hypothetical protein
LPDHDDPAFPPLSEREKSLLSYLAVQAVAAQTGHTEEEASDALDELAGRGLAAIYWDDQLAILTVDGHDLVAADRDWLRLRAHDPAMN